MNDMNDFWLGSDELDMMLPSSGRHRFNRRLDRRMAMRHIGRNVCFGKGGGGSMPDPDPMIGQAAYKNAQVGEEWLGFAKDQFAEGNKRLEVTDALTNEVIRKQLATQDESMAWAREDRARQKDVFQPLQDEFIKTAKNYDSAENQDRAAAEAAADVQKAAGTQSEINRRTMASMGVNPASGRFAGVARSDATNTALAEAGASNTARRQVRDRALDLKGAAINMGNGLSASTASAYGIGVNAGNSAVGNNATANADFYKNNGVMQAGMGGAVSANQSAGSMLNSLYGSQIQGWAAQQQSNATSSAGIGQLVGTGIGAYAAL